MEVSLLRSSSRPDPFPEVGERSFRIGLTETAGQAMTLKALGQRFAHRDLPYASNRSHKGSLPLDGQFLEVSGAVVTAVKVAEDRNGLILRLATLEDTSVTVKMPGLEHAWLCDLAEQNLESCPADAQTLTITPGANRAITVRLV